MKPHALERVAIEYLQHFAQGDAARTRRGRGDDAVASIGTGNRRRLSDRVSGKILASQQSAVSAAGLADGRRDRTVIKRVSTAIADGLQGPGKILLLQAISRHERRAVVQKNRRNIRAGAKCLSTLHQDIDIAPGQNETVRCKANRRRDERRAGQGSVFLARHFQAHHRARNSDRQITIHAAVLDDGPLRIEEHVRTGCQRRLFAEIDEGIAAVGQVNGHEAAAAQIAAAGMRHRQGVSHRDRGVHGVATLAQYHGSDVRGFMLSAHHHALARFQFEGGGGARRCAYCERQREAET